MTPLLTAARAIDLVVNQGYSKRGAADLLGISDYTVAAVLSGEHGWAEKVNQPVVRRYLEEQKARKRIAWQIVENKTLKRIEEKLDNPLDNASLSQLFVGAGIARDKAATLAGDPTVITANLDVHVLEAGDKLAALLANALTTKSKSINISPNQTDK